MFNRLRRDGRSISSYGLARCTHLRAIMINNAGRSIKLRRFYNAFKHTRATSESLTTSTQACRRLDTDAARSRAGNADLSVQNDSGGKKPRTKIVMERRRYRAETGNQFFLSLAFCRSRGLQLRIMPGFLPP